jgi:hypothetical protein
MKEVYLAYFDFMGFKNFILNNDDEHIMRRMNHIFRDIQICCGTGNYTQVSPSIIVPDLSQSKINSLNISDTVLFWTNECNYNDLKELIEVAYEFNQREVNHNFPLRGAIVKGSIKEVSNKNESEFGGLHSIQCLYGKGLVSAHDIAEAQQWAGCIVHDSIINDLLSEPGALEFIERLAVKYNVPFKENYFQEFYAFKLKKGKINNEDHLRNALNAIEHVFSQDNKPIDCEDVKLKIKNTQDFITFNKDVE